MSEVVTLGSRIKSIDEKSQKGWKTTRYALTAILILVTVAAILFGASLLRFQLLTDAQSVISILTPIFIYSFFVERAVEVFTSVWRAGDSDTLKLAVKQNVEKTKRASSAALSELHTLQHQLSQYKATTRDITFVISFVIGILISLAGVRALALFVDPVSLADLSPVQSTCFVVLDIFVTGALVGGGSDWMHKLVTMTTALFDSTKEKALASAEARTKGR